MKNQKSVQLFEASEIQSRIVAVRNVQVMLDRDLAVLYGVQTKVLNQAVKRNIERFPDRFMFRLVESEMRELVTNCDRFETLKHSGVPMYAFTEQGVAMLSAVLRSKIAIDVSIRIMDAFVAMRRFAYDHAGLVQRVGAIETTSTTDFSLSTTSSCTGLARPSTASAVASLPTPPATRRRSPSCWQCCRERRRRRETQTLENGPSRGSPDFENLLSLDAWRSQSDDASSAICGERCRSAR